MAATFVSCSKDPEELGHLIFPVPQDFVIMQIFNEDQIHQVPLVHISLLITRCLINMCKNEISCLSQVSCPYSHHIFVQVFWPTWKEILTFCKYTSLA